jgi:hypothetical protein
LVHYSEIQPWPPWTVNVAIYLLYSLLNPLLYSLLSSGALLVDRGIQKLNRQKLKTAAVLILTAGGSFLLPDNVPILPLDMFIKYSNFVHIDDEFQFEEGQPFKLPQDYADMFGWPEMAETQGF